MKLKSLHLIISPFLIMVLAIALFQGCTPDSAGELGAKPSSVAFSMTPIAGRANTYLLTSTAVGAWGWQWNKGSGTFVKGKEVDTAYFPLKGTYKVQLRAYGDGGYETAEQSVTIAVDDILNNAQFKLLTAKSWKLDPTPGANAIIVGTEGNPGEYFGGGGLDACQTDDVYTFTTALKLTYAANGSTFNAGNLAPNYSCSADRSYSAVTYTFEPGVTAGAGLATITLPAAVPVNFIGVTDVSSNFYRIISISANAMVLRSGKTNETVHQFKFVAQ